MKLTRIQQLAVGIGVILLAIVLAKFVFLKGKQDTVDRTISQNKDLQSKIRLARKYQNQVAQIREEMVHLQAQLDRIKDVLPTSVNKPKFMADLKRLANENGIELVALSQNRPVRKDVVIEHPFTVSAKGAYHDFGRFFASLSDYSRIVNVKGLSLSRDMNAGSTVDSTFLVSMFTYVEPTKEELVQQIADRKAEKSGAGKNRRARRR